MSVTKEEIEREKEGRGKRKKKRFWDACAVGSRGHARGRLCPGAAAAVPQASAAAALTL